MLKMAILIQEKECDGWIRKHGSASKEWIGGFRDAALGNATNYAECSRKEQGQYPHKKKIAHGKCPQENAVDQEEKCVLGTDEFSLTCGTILESQNSNRDHVEQSGAGEPDEVLEPCSGPAM